MKKKHAVYLAIVTLALLHQDLWFWKDRSLVFGFLPVGLAYHAGFSVAAALTMWMLVRYAWPSHIEAEVESQEPEAAEDR